MTGVVVFSRLCPTCQAEEEWETVITSVERPKGVFTQTMTTRPVGEAVCLVKRAAS